MSVDTISSERLELPALSAEQMEALLAGEVAPVTRAIGATFSRRWLQNNAWLLARRARQIRDDPAVEKWLLRLIVVRHGTHPVAGTINFHAGPDRTGPARDGRGRLRPAAPVPRARLRH